MTRHLRHATNFHGFAISIASIITLAAAPVRANVTFNLIPDPGMPQFAIDGFSAAAGLWSSMLADDITVNIQIGFSPLGPGIIGETSSEFIERSYPHVFYALYTHRTSPDDYSSFAGLQVANTYNRLINHTSNNPNGPNSAEPYVDTMDRVGMTTANAKVLGLLAPDSSLDATIRFSSDFSFDFRHGAAIDPGQFDFVGAAAHEIGHALGFVSGVDDIDSLNGILAGGDFSSNLIDLFRYSESSLSVGAGYTDYTADARDKFFSVNDGATPIALFATGVDFGDGRQASHWKDNLGIGIMDPTAGSGERLDISANDLLAFDVMGYALVPEPGTGVFFGAGLLFVLVRSPRRRPE